MNLNEIMFRLSYNNIHLEKEDMMSYFVYACVIGKELEKRRIELLEIDPKNLYRNMGREIKVGSCLKFLPPDFDWRSLTALPTDNVTYRQMTAELPSCSTPPRSSRTKRTSGTSGMWRTC